MFADVSEELSRILLLYLLPALLDAADGSQQLQCFSRTYRKQTMDFRVCTRQAADATAAGAAVVDEAAGSSALAASAASSTAVDKQPPPAPSVLGASTVDTNCDSFAPLAQAPPETEETEAPHLFDCVDLERRGAARNPVPHGPGSCTRLRQCSSHDL